MQEVELRISTMKAASQRILTQSLTAVETTRKNLEAGSHGKAMCIRTWKLFILMPRMLISHTKHGGQAGERAVHKKIGMFDRGEWGALLSEYRRTHSTIKGSR